MTNSTAKKETVLKTFPVPVHFKNLLTTAVINHPDYKNTTEFVIDCFAHGLQEIRAELKEISPEEQIQTTSEGKLSSNIAKELKDFLDNNSIDSLLEDKDCETSISLNMDKNDFLQLKSKVPLSQYKELKVFYLHQIFNGLKRML